jgi:heterodisulfide reductase subunit B
MSKSLKEIVPIGHIYIRDNVLEKGSLTGVGESKAAWARSLDLPQKAEYTFFAGCGYQHMKYIEGMMGALKRAEKIGVGMGKVIGISKAFSKVGIDLTSISAKMTASKDDPYTEILRSAISVLRKLEVDIGYLQEEEPCCGSPLYYSGFEEEYADHARNNYNLFKKLKVKKVIGLIPACTSSFKYVYPKYIPDYDLEVQHFFEIVSRRLKETGKKLKIKDKVTITYHEPCQLSRYLEIIEEPREILNRIEGIEFKEVGEEQREKWSTCCGGGGLEASHPQLAERIGLRRMEELLKTRAPIILTNCPACEMQLGKAATKLNADVKVVDFVKLLDGVLD